MAKPKKKPWILGKQTVEVKVVPPEVTKLGDEKLLTSHEVAKLLQVNASSVVKWTKDGILPTYRTPGGHRRVLVSDLREFVVKRGMYVPMALRV
jgi:excisionase family DNA binding protein